MIAHMHVFDPKWTEQLRTNQCGDRISLEGISLTTEEMQAFAQALRENTCLHTLHLTDCHLTDAQLQMLGEALRENHTLHTLHIDGEQAYGSEGLCDLAGSLGYNHGLISLTCADIAEGDKNFSRALRNNGNKTLAETSPLQANSQGALACQQNGTNAHFYGDNIARSMQKADGFSTIRIVDLCGMAARLPTVIYRLKNFSEKPEKANMVRTAFAKIPSLPERPVTLEELFAPHPEAANLTLLDNAATWRELPRVARELAEQGTPLTKAHLMQRNRDGETYLMSGLHSTNLGRILSALAVAKEHLAPEDLLDTTGRPNQFLERIGANRELAALFCKENWLPQPLTALQKVYQAIVPAVKDEQVMNYHGLLHSIQHTQRADAPDKGRG